MVYTGITKNEAFTFSARTLSTAGSYNNDLWATTAGSPVFRIRKDSGSWVSPTGSISKFADYRSNIVNFSLSAEDMNADRIDVVFYNNNNNNYVGLDISVSIFTGSGGGGGDAPTAEQIATTTKQKLLPFLK